MSTVILVSSDELEGSLYDDIVDAVLDVVAGLADSLIDSGLTTTNDHSVICMEILKRVPPVLRSVSVPVLKDEYHALFEAKTPAEKSDEDISKVSRDFRLILGGLNTKDGEA